MHEWRALGDDASGSDAQRAARATRVKCMAEAVPGAESGAYWGYFMVKTVDGNLRNLTILVVCSSLFLPHASFKP